LNIGVSMPTYHVPESLRERLSRTEINEPRNLNGFYNSVSAAGLPLDLIRLEFENNGRVTSYNRHQYQLLREKQEARRNGAKAHVYVTLDPDAEIEFVA